MTADTQVTGAAAQFREAVADLTQLAACTSRPGAEGIRAWADLARDLADRSCIWTAWTAGGHCGTWP
jgi:hypothetical protein